MNTNARSFPHDGVPGAPPAAARWRTLAFAGDVMLGRLVNEALRTRPVEYVWGDTLPLLLEADARFVNLECVISDRGEPWHPLTKAFHFRALPWAIDALKAAHIDCVSLANNHILDCGEAAMADCLQRLQAAGIDYAGAGPHLVAAMRPARIDVDGLTVGVVSCTDNTPEWAAGERAPGVYFVEPGAHRSEAALLAHLAAVRPRMDVLVLSIHWGPNMTTFPHAAFVSLARRAVEAGVDIVHGHSAHVFHGIGIHAGRPILYDTGDWVDDYAVDSDLRNDWTFLYLLRLQGRTPREITAVPCVIEHLRVRRARAEARTLVAQLAERCGGLGAACDTAAEQLVIRIGVGGAPAAAASDQGGEHGTADQEPG